MRRLVSARAAGLTLAGSALLLGLGAGAASAHVTVSAPGATQGGFGTLSVKVPTESDTASTVGLKLLLPTATPIASVAIQPHPGWSYTVKTAKPATPLSSDDGPVTSVVTEIDWTATAGGIRPGQFDQFLLSVGPLPKVATLSFRAVQTYSDGTAVNWIETPAQGSTAEPEHPAPSISLAPATTTATPATTTNPAAVAPVVRSGNTALDYTALSVGLGGLAVGALGVVLALRRRREILVADMSAAQRSSIS
jgi:uncharacterized protein YcnI